MADSRQYTVLLVDDDRAVLQALEGLFSDDYNTIIASSGDEAIEIVRKTPDIGAVVMDIRMPRKDGIATTREIRDINPSIRVIFHTGYPGDYDEDELDAREQPFAYVQKADPISRLKREVRNAIDAYHLEHNSHDLQAWAERELGIIGGSDVMKDVYRKIRQIAPTGQNVVVVGETGTGKELVANAIHTCSTRRDKRIAPFNCNHVSKELVGADLFGWVKGAFTGAEGHRMGLFEYADGGTVFLDEVGDLGKATQGYLLRVLESGEYSPLGQTEKKYADVRVVCATQIALEDLVKNGFREDLYYRLSGTTIVLPPLRERKEDIPALVHRFADRFTFESDLQPKLIDGPAMECLVTYDWPGNVRHLMTIVESLVNCSTSGVISRRDVEESLNLAPCREKTQNFRMRVRDYEKSLIVAALADHAGNIAAAARYLGMDRGNLRKKIIDLSISMGDFTSD